MLRTFFSKTVNNLSQQSATRFFGTAHQAVESAQSTLQNSSKNLSVTPYKNLADLPDHLKAKIPPELLKKNPKIIDPRELEKGLEYSEKLRNFSKY